MAKNESAETTVDEAGVDEVDEFDKERALKTIRAQRANEKEQSAEIARLRAIEAEVEKAKATEAEAQKGLETKLAESQARIAELESQAAESAIKSDFITKAGERGYKDPGLAYLAAKDAGVLGELDPATGNVKVHDFDNLEERFPALAGEASEERELGTGDAGVRGHRGKTTVGSKFNKAIRGAL